MKAELSSFACGLLLTCTIFAFTRIDLSTERYETQYIAMYDDGHTKMVCTESQPPREVGGTFNHGAGRWKVVSAVDYWYDGLDLGTQYYIAKVRLMR